ncbi:MAG: c-type cytochrome [Epsilonproteobacteria bacterium]|nr:c-type cytochrome [Campylobacterota bacterium]
MKRLLIALMWVGAVTYVEATDYNEKGMKAYKKLCMSCHGSGDYGAAQLRQDEWEDLMAFRAKRLIDAHKNDPKSFAILTKKSSQKKYKYLAEFLIGAAKDSGSVGGCDGNRCGVQSGKVMMKKESE